jgi:hypothetical protein
MYRIAPMHAKQRGLTMFGFLFVAIMLVLVAMVAMKLVPAYIEFYTLKEIIATMGHATDIRTKSNRDIRNEFSARSNTSYVTVVKPDDLVITREGGVPVISVDYEYRTKLVGNVSLVVDFSASSDPDAAPAQLE